MAMVRRLRNVVALLAAGAALGAGLAALPGRAHAQGGMEYYVTLKLGLQDAEKSSDNLVEDFEMDHGPLVGDRKVETRGVEVDVVMFPDRIFGVGLGLEYHVYDKRMDFRDPNAVLPEGHVEIKGKAVLYTLKFYARTGPVLSYFGLGSGNYFLKYFERGAFSFRDTSRNVFTTRLGARILLTESFNLLLEYGRTRAPVVIEFRARRPQLDLGGTFLTIGLGVSF